MSGPSCWLCSPTQPPADPRERPEVVHTPFAQVCERHHCHPPVVGTLVDGGCLCPQLSTGCGRTGGQRLWTTTAAFHTSSPGGGQQRSARTLAPDELQQPLRTVGTSSRPPDQVHRDERRVPRPAVGDARPTVVRTRLGRQPDGLTCGDGRQPVLGAVDGEPLRGPGPDGPQVRRPARCGAARRSAALRLLPRPAALDGNGVRPRDAHASPDRGRDRRGRARDPPCDGADGQGAGCGSVELIRRWVWAARSCQ